MDRGRVTILCSQRRNNMLPRTGTCSIRPATRPSPMAARATDNTDPWLCHSTWRRCCQRHWWGRGQAAQTSRVLQRRGAPRTSCPSRRRGRHWCGRCQSGGWGHGSAAAAPGWSRPGCSWCGGRSRLPGPGPPGHGERAHGVRYAQHQICLEWANRCLMLQGHHETVSIHGFISKASMWRKQWIFNVECYRAGVLDVSGGITKEKQRRGGPTSW